MTGKIRARLAYWLTVAGAVVALPIAVFATCQLRGPYVPPPEERFPLGPESIHEGTSILIGLAIGAPFVIALAMWAVILRRRAKGPGQEPPGRN